MEYRRVERQQPDGTFVAVQFSELKRGDKFKLFGSAGDHEDGSVLYEADTNAVPTAEPGNWSIQVL